MGLSLLAGLGNNAVSRIRRRGADADDRYRRTTLPAHSALHRAGWPLSTPRQSHRRDANKSVLVCGRFVVPAPIPCVRSASWPVSAGLPSAPSKTTTHASLATIEKLGRSPRCFSCVAGVSDRRTAPVTIKRYRRLCLWIVDLRLGVVRLALQPISDFVEPAPRLGFRGRIAEVAGGIAAGSGALGSATDSDGAGSASIKERGCSTFPNGATCSKTRGRSSLACRTRTPFSSAAPSALQLVEQYKASSRTISGIAPAQPTRA